MANPQTPTRNRLTPAAVAPKDTTPAEREKMQRERDDDRHGEDRNRRVPFHLQSQVHSAKVPAHMVGHEFNDVPGRIDAAFNAGYVFIGANGEISDRDGALKRHVGRNVDGSGMNGYLMAIPRELYEEDQRAKQAEIDKTDDVINRRLPPAGGHPDDYGLFYDPDHMNPGQLRRR